MYDFVNRRSEAVGSLALCTLGTLMTLAAVILVFVFRADAVHLNFEGIALIYGLPFLAVALIDADKMKKYFLDVKGLCSRVNASYAAMLAVGTLLSAAAVFGDSVAAFVVCLVLIAGLYGIMLADRIKLIVKHKDEKSPKVKGFLKKYVSRTELR
ncbi:MAG: hypothetical protein IJR90_09590 [Clostridia bacterium]|nr:hypothetical protein [Clostridia bacterium]